MIEYQPAWRYAVTATMNIAKNTNDIPINGIFANKSMRAMRPTSIDRMKVVPVNTFRRCGGGEMETRAPPAGGGAREQHVSHPARRRGGCVCRRAPPRPRETEEPH